MRTDLVHFAVLIAFGAGALALGLALGWSDGALGVATLAATAAGLFAGDRIAEGRRGNRSWSIFGARARAHH
jgi:hypothetical protein